MKVEDFSRNVCCQNVHLKNHLRPISLWTGKRVCCWSDKQSGANAKKANLFGCEKAWTQKRVTQRLPFLASSKTHLALSSTLVRKKRTRVAPALVNQSGSPIN